MNDGVTISTYEFLRRFPTEHEADLADIEVAKKLVGALLRIEPDEDVSVVSDSTGAFGERER